MTLAQKIALDSGTFRKPGILTIRIMRMVRFIQVGYLLHLMAIAGIVLSYVSWQYTQLFFAEQRWLLFLIALYFAVYGFSLPFFAELDARSRYQNYKMIKDRLYENGYHNLLVKPLSFSRCQRDAVSVAAGDLGIKNEVNAYYQSLGYRWYHILPHLILQNPRLLLTAGYWKNTLLVKTYHSRHFLW